MIKCYNECLLSGIENTDAEKISWTAGLKSSFKKGQTILYSKTDFVISLYRPFCKYYLYYNRDVIERPGLQAAFLEVTT